MTVQNTTIIVATKDNDEAMVSFYKDVLGFTANNHGGYVLGNIELYFDRHDKASSKNPEPFRYMLTFKVSDIKAVCEELKTKEVKFVRDPAKESWGGWLATFEDPDGNYLQLFQES